MKIKWQLYAPKRERGQLGGSTSVEIPRTFEETQIDRHVSD